MKKPGITVLILAFFLLTGCKKDKVPVITTSDIDEITETTATGGGNITNDGGATITARGVCWSTGEKPTISDNKTTDGSGKGGFSSKITGLTRSNRFYVRAYATNSVGTGYGDAIYFSTPFVSPGPPIATTKGVTDVTNNSAVLWGTVYANYSVATATFELGTTQNYGDTFEYKDGFGFAILLTGGNNISVFIQLSKLGSLTPRTTYHYRTVAKNEYGTSYGDDRTFFTKAK